MITKFPNIGLDSIEVFSCYPDLQIRYIESLLEREKKKLDEEEMSDKLKMRYLELKCQISPDMVVKMMSIYNFPLEESLVVCRKFGNQHSVAHITYRLGRVSEAVLEYSNIIREAYSSYLKGEQRSDLKKAISDAEFSFQMAIDIC